MKAGGYRYGGREKGKTRSKSPDLSMYQSVLGNACLTGLMENTPSPPIIQRKIDFDTTPAKVLPFKNIEELVEGMAGYYGEEYRELIERMAAELEEEEKTYSLDEVHHQIVRNIEAKLPLGGSKDPRSAYNQLAFTTATRASMHSEALEAPIETRNSKKGHAERIILEKLGKCKQKSEQAFLLTINNSPCLRCAWALVKWVLETGNRLTVRFCNFYGKSEEFNQSLKIMRDAGIKVHTYDLAELHPDWISKEYRKRMSGLSKRQSKMRGETGFESDSEEGMKAEDSSEPGFRPEEERRQSPLLGKLIRDAWYEDTGSDIYVANGIRYIPVRRDVRSAGECLWDSLRVIGFSEESLQAAARMTGLTVDQPVEVENAFRLVDNLGGVTGVKCALEITEFYYGNPEPQNVVRSGEGMVIHLAFFHLPLGGNGHFVPSM